MQEVFDKLSIRTTDYVATIGVKDERFLSQMLDSVKGMVCVGDINKKKFKNLENVKVVKSVGDLDNSAFDKVLVSYGDNFRAKELIDISDNLGMVLVGRLPKDMRGKGFKIALRKMGIFEIWELERNLSNSVDLLFRVRKY